MFNDFVVQPIFNLLVLVYALIPGHNFGLALIVFTIIVRILLWPLLRKQLHQTKAMRALQPELKKIKQKAKGDRQKQQLLTLELYKEKGINPVGTFPILIVQFIVLIGLYIGLQKVIKDPHQLIDFAYKPLQNLGTLKELKGNIKLFDNTLFGLVDLKRAAKGPEGFYFPAFLLVAGSAAAQFFQSRQLIPQSKDQRSLREIMKAAGEGKPAEQDEVNAAVSRFTIYILPISVFFFTLGLPSALSLYWLVGGLVAYIQQSRVLQQDEVEMEAIAETKKDISAIPEAEVIESPKASSNKNASKKRRKKR